MLKVNKKFFFYYTFVKLFLNILIIINILKKQKKQKNTLHQTQHITKPSNT